jgi:hypothetical protein
MERQYIKDAGDEVSLLEFFTNLKRYVSDNYSKIFRNVFIFIALVFSGVLFGVLSSPPQISYSQKLSFSFPQAEQNLYPNGSQFSIADLLANDVLETVYDANQLDKQGIRFDDFSNSLSIVYFSENELFIKAKYQGMLSRKNLSSTDISSIERDFNSELDSARRKQAQISLTTPFDSPLSGRLARKVITDIPAAWSQKAIQKLGVLSIPNSGLEGVNEEVVKRGSLFQVVDYFAKYVDAIDKSLKIISAYPGGETLKDPLTGANVEILKQNLVYLNQYWILAFDYYVQQHNQANDIDLKSAELSLNELNEIKKQYLANAETYKQAYKNYQKENSSHEVDLNGKQHNTSGFQLEGDSLQRLIDIGTQNKDSEFRQELTTKGVQYELKANAMNLEIMKLDQRIKAAKKSVGTEALDAEKVVFYTSEIVKQLSGLSESIKRIESVYMNKFKNSRGELFLQGSITQSLASSLVSVVFVPFAIIALAFTILIVVAVIKKLNRE